MWPWKSQAKASELPELLEKRLRSLEEKQASVDGMFRKLKLEWEDVYDRLERIVGRINARARSEKRALEQEPAGVHAPASIADIDAAIRNGTFVPPRNGG